MGSYIEQRKKYQQTVLSEHQRSGLSPYRLSKIYPVAEETIRRWIINFANENPASEMKQLKGTVRLSTEKSATRADSVSSAQETAEQKIARLEQALKEARLRADFYDEMITVAESKFDIQIRKKVGAKR